MRKALGLIPAPKKEKKKKKKKSCALFFYGPSPRAEPKPYSWLVPNKYW
jgi:hypothetical protein